MNHMPDFILNHLPFTSQYQYNKLKNSLAIVEKKIDTRDSIIANDHVIIDSLNLKSIPLTSKINSNTKMIKSVGKNVAGLDSILSASGAL